MAIHPIFGSSQEITNKGEDCMLGNIEDMEYVLCSKENEDIDHLLFKCDCAKQMWSKLLFWQGIQREVSNW